MTARRKNFKAYLKMKENTANPNKKGKYCVSKWEQQVGKLVIVKCQAVYDSVDSIANSLQWTLKRQSTDKPAFIRSCK
jgi:hypothetical protein